MLSFRIGHVIEHYFFDIIFCIPEISFCMSKMFHVEHLIQRRSFSNCFQIPIPCSAEAISSFISRVFDYRPLTSAPISRLRHGHVKKEWPLYGAILVHGIMC